MRDSLWNEIFWVVKFLYFFGGTSLTSNGRPWLTQGLPAKVSVLLSILQILPVSVIYFIDVKSLWLLLFYIGIFVKVLKCFYRLIQFLKCPLIDVKSIVCKVTLLSFLHELREFILIKTLVENFFH